DGHAPFRARPHPARPISRPAADVRGSQGRTRARPSSPAARDVPRPRSRLQLGRGSRRGGAPRARHLGADGGAHLRASRQARARPARPRHPHPCGQGPAGQQAAPQRLRRGREGDRRGCLRRRPQAASRARAPRPLAGHADRGGHRERIRGAGRGPDQGQVAERPARTRKGDLRGSDRLMAVKAVKTAVTQTMVLGAGDALPGELRVLRAAERSLTGERRGLRALAPFLGPAFIAAVAYVDPGNFATNMSGGAQFGYMLLWVVLAANLMAMLIQSMSAKLGIATGRSLPEVCRDRFPRPVVVFLCIQAELIAMATDLAEFVGAALGIYLVFGIPLFVAGIVTGVVAFRILALQSSGFRRLEATIAGLVGVIVIGFGLEVCGSHASCGQVATSTFVPHLDGKESILLAAGILGATVMPHVIY